MMDFRERSGLTNAQIADMPEDELRQLHKEFRAGQPPRRNGEIKKMSNVVRIPAQSWPEAIVTLGDKVVPEQVDWIWPGFLARGMIHLFAGAPGTGKTTLALAYMATITAGWRACRARQGAYLDGRRRC